MSAQTRSSPIYPDCGLISQFNFPLPLNPRAQSPQEENLDPFTRENSDLQIQMQSNPKARQMSDFNILQTPFDALEESFPDEALFTPFSEGFVWNQILSQQVDILSQQAAQSPWTGYLTLTSLSSPDADGISARPCAQALSSIWPALDSLVLRTPSPASNLASSETSAVVAGSATEPRLPHFESRGETQNLPDVAGPKKTRTRLLTDRRRETNAVASKRSRARKKEQFESMSDHLTKLRVSTPLRGD